MIVIYCAKDKQDEAVKAIKPNEPYLFESPMETNVNHTATKVVVVGDHPAIVERYKGIAKVETLELKKPKESKKEEAE